MRVCVFSTCPKGVFSGGRYHALMVAQALARRGHECYFVTNNTPIFAEDLAPISPGNPVTFVTTAEFDVGARARFDAVFLAPQMGRYPRLYKNAIRFARATGAALFLINYETPNWFNALCPEPRPEGKWRDWSFAPNAGCLVLCSAHESVRFAREYYRDIPPGTEFGVWQPAINSVLCAAAPDGPRERRIVLFARLHDKHKGGDDIGELLATPELHGYTLSIIIGNRANSASALSALERRGREHGVEIEPLFALSDYDKFKVLKRAAAVVFPSYFEGYGYPPVEALATDTPCVAYDLPVVRENCRDLIRYAPVGDVRALRRELVAALRTGPRSTSTDPHVKYLTDVDERSAALERTVEDYVGRCTRNSPRRSAMRCEITPISRIPGEGAHLAFFVLTSDRDILDIHARNDAVVDAQVHHGPWVESRRQHGVFLKLRHSDVDIDSLTGTSFHVQFDDCEAQVSLRNVKAAELPHVPRLPHDCGAVNKVLRNGDDQLILGWAYPFREYDSLYLADKNGYTVRLDTAIKNLHFAKHHPSDLEELCGFLGWLDASRLSPEGLRLVFVRNGLVRGIGALAIPHDDEHDELPLVGPLSGTETDGAGPKPAGGSGAETATVIPPTVTIASHQPSEPVVRRQRRSAAVLASAGKTLDRFRAGAQKRVDRIARMRRKLRGNDLQWALSEWRYDERLGAVVIRGWTSMPDDVRVEVWLDAANERLGRAQTGISRPDVAKTLKISTRNDFGFAFQMSCDRDMVSDMRIRVFKRARELASRAYETIVNGRTLRNRFDVNGFHFDSTWRILWIRGLFANPRFRPEKLEVLKEGAPIACGVLRHETRPDGTRVVSWRVESVIAQSLQPHDVLILRMTDGAKAEKERVYHVPDPVDARGAGSPAEAKPAAPTLSDLLDSRGEPLKPHDHLVLMIVHNLNSAERPEKRRALEQLRAALNERGAELVILHHAGSASGCTVPEINFFNRHLGRAPLTPEFWNTLEENGTLHYCTRLVYGFEAARNHEPKPWNDCSRQVCDEARRVEAAIQAARPSTILLWHQWNSLMMLGRAIATRRDTASGFVHEGMLPGTMTIDSAGMMAEASLTGQTVARNEDNAAYFERVHHMLAEIKHKKLDRKPQVAAPAVEEILDRLRSRGARTVFYAGINDWQSGNLPADHPRAKLHSPHFSDTEDALRPLLDVARAHDFYILYKPHPNLFPRVPDLEDERLIYLREASTPTCIEKTDATVTLLSSIAYISLAHEKPTVLLGRNTLSGAHAAYELERRDELEGLMVDALAAKGMQERLRRYEEHLAALLKSELLPYGGKTDFAVLDYQDAADRVLSLLKETGPSETAEHTSAFVC